MRKLLTTHAAAAVIIIRLMVGAVFVSEGMQKFLFFADAVGRFTQIGIPAPHLTTPVVACFEIGCGALAILGLATRLAAIPLVVIMLTAIATTKIPILMNDGFWKMAHEARTDWSMLLGSIFLLVVGGGAWSVDALWSRRGQS